MHTQQKAALSSDATPDDGGLKASQLSSLLVHRHTEYSSCLSAGWSQLTRIGVLRLNNFRFFFAGHPAGDGVRPKARLPAQPDAKGHQKYKRKLPTAVEEFQTPQLGDGPVRKTKKTRPKAKAGDRVMQPPQSSAKAQSGPASNAVSHPTSVEKEKKKNNKKQALLQQSVTGDITDAIVCKEQKELRMEMKPRKGQAPEQGAAGSAAGLKSESKRQSVPVRKKNSEEAKPIKQAETGSTVDVNNADSMPGIPGASTGAMTWRELDKRTDVKRGRFSQTEKETLLEAIKVSSSAC